MFLNFFHLDSEFQIQNLNEFALFGSIKMRKAVSNFSRIYFLK